MGTDAGHTPPFWAVGRKLVVLGSEADEAYAEVGSFTSEELAAKAAVALNRHRIPAGVDDAPSLVARALPLLMSGRLAPGRQDRLMESVKDYESALFWLTICLAEITIEELGLVAIPGAEDMFEPDELDPAPIDPDAEPPS